jgi:hypothetical protein
MMVLRPAVILNPAADRATMEIPYCPVFLGISRL